MPSNVTAQRVDSKNANDDLMAQCAQACNEAVAYCLKKGGKHAEAAHIQTLLDCAEICALAARLSDRGSALEAQAMELCATACKASQESCETFEGDAKMDACADVSRECCGHCSS